MKLQRTDVNQVKKQVPQTLKAIQSDSEPDIPMPKKLKQYFESRQSSKDRNKPGKNKEDS